MKKIVLLCLMVSIGLSGCGNVSKDGSTSVFQTGTVTYVPPTSNNFGATVTTPPNAFYSNVDATVTVSTTTFQNIIKASDFTIKNITTTYKKYLPQGDSSFTMKRFAPDMPLKAGGTVAIGLTLALADIKDELVTNHGFSPGSSSWSFYVNTDFDVIEDLSGDSRHYSVQLGTINFQ